MDVALETAAFFASIRRSIVDGRAVPFPLSAHPQR